MPDLPPSRRYRVRVTRPDSPNRGRLGTVTRTYHPRENPQFPEKLKKPGWADGPPMLWVMLDGEKHPVFYEADEVEEVRA